MPEDLTMTSPIPLTESPHSIPQSIASSRPGKTSTRGNEDAQIQALLGLANHSELEAPPQSKEMALHPYTRILSPGDVNSCTALENAAFENEAERCTREKFLYRLTKCGELSMGLFHSVPAESDFKAETLATGRVVETGRKDGAIGVLLAQIVATKSIDDVVTDNAMDYPKDWNSASASTSRTGHQERGRTVCIHSLAVLPGFRGRRLGKTLLNSYIQNIAGAGIADRIALLAHENMVPYYESFGFKNKGMGKAEFGGGGWCDMVKELRPVEVRATYGI